MTFFTEGRLELRLCSRARSERECGTELCECSDLPRLPMAAVGDVIPGHGVGMLPGKLSQHFQRGMYHSREPRGATGSRDCWRDRVLRLPPYKMQKIVDTIPVTYCRIGSRCCVPEASLSSFRRKVSLSLFFPKRKKEKKNDQEVISHN